MAAGLGPQVVNELGLGVQRVFLNFLETFDAGDGEDGSQRSLYARMVDDMKARERTTLMVDFEHLDEYSRIDDRFESVRTTILQNFYEVEPYLRKAVQARCASAAPAPPAHVLTAPRRSARGAPPAVWARRPGGCIGFPSPCWRPR